MFRTASRTCSRRLPFLNPQPPLLRRLSSTSSPATTTPEPSSRKSRVGDPLTREGIASLLSEGTWSVSELLEPPSTSTPASESEEITPAKLHHLLRLSALPLPASQAEEDSMIATLREQLHFVRRVQQVDTAGVEPLVAIRNETAAASRGREITLESLRHVLDGEEQVGRYRRIVKKKRDEVESDELDNLSEEERLRRQDLDWDPLERAPEKVGRFIKVNIEQR